MVAVPGSMNEIALHRGGFPGYPGRGTPAAGCGKERDVVAGSPVSVVAGFLGSRGRPPASLRATTGGGARRIGR